MVCQVLPVYLAFGNQYYHSLSYFRFLLHLRLCSIRIMLGERIKMHHNIDGPKRHKFPYYINMYNWRMWVPRNYTKNAQSYVLNGQWNWYLEKFSSA